MGEEADDIETAEKAKPLWGDKPYQRRARRALTLLIQHAEKNTTVTYGELGKELGDVRARNMNFILGSLGKSRLLLSRAWGKEIPPIETLAVNGATFFPGVGVDPFLPTGTSAAQPGEAERNTIITRVHESVFRYPSWREVEKALALAVSNHAAGLPEFDTGPRVQRYWWVNHKQTHRQEIEGEVLWSPKVNRKGANNESYNNMVRTQPGDVVFWIAGGEIRAVGLVKGPAVETPKPPEFRAVGDQWGEDLGWAVPVKFALLKSPLDIQAHASELASVLPPKHSPIQANGHGNQGTYLAAVPGPMADVLRRLIGPALEEELAGLTLLMGSGFSDDVAEARLQQRTDIGPTQKKTLVDARRGLGIYRGNLERVEGSCRVTGLSDRRHLRARHIKPWRDCDDRERLDGFNGLLLSPHIDHLFDQGHISFTAEGEMLVSRHLNPAVLKRWGLVMPRNVGAFAAEQRAYLDYHRAKIFEKDAGGRRGG